MDMHELVRFLDGFLDVATIPDGPGALNGLQVQNSGEVNKLLAAVDACQFTIDEAVRRGADMLVVHHGLFWGERQPVTDRQWRRLRALLENDIAVYSAHLPLDLHPDVGNNAILARQLELQSTAPFGEYQGVAIGLLGRADVSRTDFIDRVGTALGQPPHVIAAGPERVERVGVVTGGGGSMIDQARAAGLDTLVTGEGGHHTYFDAEEWGINLIYGGHYATETFGVKALVRTVSERFELSWEFVDHPTGL